MVPQYHGDLNLPVYPWYTLWETDLVAVSTMSSTPGRLMQSPRHEHHDDNAVDPSELFGALEDGHCRAIIEATSDEALTVSELCEACDLSSSTAYRKIERLTEAGLLEENVRFSPSGSHKSEYRLAMSAVEVTVEDGRIDCSVSTRETIQSYAMND